MISNINYKIKYLEYKQKYLSLKNKLLLQKGGAEHNTIVPLVPSCTTQNYYYILSTLGDVTDDKIINRLKYYAINHIKWCLFDHSHSWDDLVFRILNLNEPIEKTSNRKVNLQTAIDFIMVPQNSQTIFDHYQAFLKKYPDKGLPPPIQIEGVPEDPVAAAEFIRKVMIENTKALQSSPVPLGLAKAEAPAEAPATAAPALTEVQSPAPAPAASSTHDKEIIQLLKENLKEENIEDIIPYLERIDAGITAMLETMIDIDINDNIKKQIILRNIYPTICIDLENSYLTMDLDLEALFEIACRLNLADEYVYMKYLIQPHKISIIKDAENKTPKLILSSFVTDAIVKDQKTPTGVKGYPSYPIDETTKIEFDNETYKKINRFFNDLIDLNHLDNLDIISEKLAILLNQILPDEIDQKTAFFILDYRFKQFKSTKAKIPPFSKLIEELFIKNKENIVLYLTMTDEELVASLNLKLQLDGVVDQLNLTDSKSREALDGFKTNLRTDDSNFINAYEILKIILVDD